MEQFKATPKGITIRKMKKYNSSKGVKKIMERELGVIRAWQNNYAKRRRERRKETQQ
jgi:hypothetical protein